jgi:hypothetical protein
MKKTIETNEQNVSETEAIDQNELTQQRQIEEITPEEEQQLTTGKKEGGTSKDGTPMF